MKLFSVTTLIFALLSSTTHVVAAPSTPVVDAATRHQVIAAIVRDLDEKYVYPDRADTAGTALVAAEKSGAFDALNDPDAFAKALTEKLAEALHDKHLSIDYSPEVLPTMSGGKPDPARIARRRAFYKSVNFGIEKAMRLRLNVGYLDVRGFPPAKLARDTVAAAMNFVANTDALIIDIRKNGGGDPKGVAQLCSYLFPAAHRVHLNDLFMRTPKTKTGKIEQYWTMRVPGPAYVNKKIFVLTSADTFSGGEEFAYDMQTQKRATLVGETTGGGANPGDQVRLSDHFEMFLPNGRAVNPITHTNWEGVGVKPDVPTTADAALLTAYLTILREKRAALTDPEDQKRMDDLIAGFTKDPNSILLQ